MNFFNKIFHKTLTYKIYDFITSTYHYIKDYNLISDTFYSDAFKRVIKRYLGVELDKDWLGRLYGIFNPNIDINGNFNFNNVIIEIDGDNTNNTEYIKNWTYKQMTLIGQLFKIEKLYDYINVEFEHVGPLNADNYLIIFDIASRNLFTKSLKKVLGQILFYIIIAFIVLLGIIIL